VSDAPGVTPAENGVQFASVPQSPLAAVDDHVYVSPRVAGQKSKPATISVATATAKKLPEKFFVQEPI
jgi:hypothetical protein